MEFLVVTAILTVIVAIDALLCPSSCWCGRARRLQTAICGNRGLTSIPRPFPQHITQIDLIFNNITRIEKGAFIGLGNLQNLDLRFNRITTINNETFKGLGNLRNLWLFGNQITFIGKGTFIGAQKLQELDLGYNKITMIDNETFSGLYSLQQLGLNNNRIAAIGHGSFSRLHNLEYLWLDYNKITSIDCDTFSVLYNLRELNLNANELTVMQFDMFDDLFKLESLHLSVRSLTCDCIMKQFNSWSKSRFQLREHSIICSHLSTREQEGISNCTVPTAKPSTQTSQQVAVKTQATTVENIIDVTINSSVGYVNTTLDIICEAHAISLTGKIAFEWKLNGSEIRPMQTSRIQLFYEKMSTIMYRSTLRINAIDESSAGIIECTAFLGKNLNRSHLSLIQLYILTIQSESLAVQNGGNTSVLCAVSPISESGIQSVTLYRDGEIIPKLQLAYFNSSVMVHLTNITNATSIGCKLMNQIKSVDILVFETEMLECTIDYSHEIVWNNTYPGITDFQSCPHGFKGQASRYCSVEGHGGKWQKPNMDNCIRAQFESILQRIKQIHDGILVDELGKVLHEFANETKAVTKANITVATDLRTSLDILAGALSTLSGREEEPTSEELEDFFSATDSIMDINTKNVWKELNEHTGENKAVTIMSIVSNISDLVLKTLPKNGSFNCVKENLALQIQRTLTGQIAFPDDILNYRSQVILPNSTILNCFNVSETVDFSAAYYRTIATFIHQYKFERMRKEVGSDVISFSVNNNKLVKKLSPPLKLFFKTVQTNLSVTECSYWDFTLPYGGNWATDGCEIVFTNNSATECRCDHLTSFAVLLSTIEISDEHHEVLTTMSIIGCTVSIVCLVLCMICYAIVWKKINYDKARKRNSDKDVILVLLCLSLICAYLTFMLGIDRTKNKVICTAVAVLLHFLLLTVLCLMAAEGIIHVVLVTAVFQRLSLKKILIPLSVVIPAGIVIISGVVTRLNGYGTDKVCWLSVDSGLIYVFFVPCVVVMSVNWIIAGVVLKTVFSIKANKNKTRTESLKIGFRSLFVMAPVFGLTWLFGLFSFGEHAIVFSYLFVVFNSLQGAVIFAVHIVLDDDVRNALKKRVFRLRKQQDFTMQSTDKTNTSNIFKRNMKDIDDTATFSCDDGAIDFNDVPVHELRRAKL